MATLRELWNNNGCKPGLKVRRDCGSKEERWQVCLRGSFDNIWRVPWEIAVAAGQRHIARLAIFELHHKPLLENDDAA
jgi:hypothetical protein